MESIGTLKLGCKLLRWFDRLLQPTAVTVVANYFRGVIAPHKLDPALSADNGALKREDSSLGAVSEVRNYGQRVAAMQRLVEVLARLRKHLKAALRIRVEDALDDFLDHERLCSLGDDVANVADDVDVAVTRLREPFDDGIKAKGLHEAARRVDLLLSSLLRNRGISGGRRRKRATLRTGGGTRRRGRRTRLLHSGSSDLL